MPTVSAPYPGLRPFVREESQVFFGREKQIDDVLARLKRNQFLGVVGTSGCGKSSLIRAGVLPALESGLMGELGSSWFIADMKPGDAPLTNLAKALMQSGVLGDRWSDSPEGIALLTAQLRRSDVSLVNLIQQVKLPKFTNLLLLADQFEEIFRFQQDPNEALAFVNLLSATGLDRTVPIYVVLTMRSDFLGHCALFSGLPEMLNDGLYLCPRLSRDQLAEAIRGPAEVFGGEVDQSLVTQIINDAGANSDQLPLVQHVLSRMWHLSVGDNYGTGAGRSDCDLGLEDYRTVGGLKGGSDKRENSSHTVQQNALSQHADEAYFSLKENSSTTGDPKLSTMQSINQMLFRSQPQRTQPGGSASRKQQIAQMLFRCLAERGQTGLYIRRPMKVQDVAAIADCSVAELIEVVNVFRREDRSFLLPSVEEKKDLSATDVLDISHEALIRQWDRFGGQTETQRGPDTVRSWMSIEEDARRRYRRLADAAENEQTAGLLRNPELGFLNQWWETFQPPKAWGEACVRGSFDRTTSFLNRSLREATIESLLKPTGSLMKLSVWGAFVWGMILWFAIAWGSSDLLWNTIFFLLMARHVFIFIGALLVRQLKYYSLARVTSLLAMVPIGAPCLLIDMIPGMRLYNLLSSSQVRRQFYADGK